MCGVVRLVVVCVSKLFDLVSKIYVSCDFGVVDVEYLLAVVMLRPDRQRFSSFDDFALYVAKLLGLANLDAPPTSDQALSVLRSLLCRCVKNAVHGKSLQSSTATESSAAARTAAAARGAASTATTGGAGVDAIDAEQYRAYAQHCYGDTSFAPIVHDAHVRATQRVGYQQYRHRRHALAKAANEPLRTAQKLNVTLGLGLSARQLRGALVVVVGNPTFASGGRNVRGHRAVPVKQLLGEFSHRYLTVVIDEYLTSKVVIVPIALCARCDFNFASLLPYSQNCTHCGGKLVRTRGGNVRYYRYENIRHILKKVVLIVVASTTN